MTMGHNHFRDCLRYDTLCTCKHNKMFAAVATPSAFRIRCDVSEAVAFQRVQFNYQHCEPIKLFMRHGMLKQLTGIAYQLVPFIPTVFFSFLAATYNLMMFVLVSLANKKPLFGNCIQDAAHFRF